MARTVSQDTDRALRARTVSQDTDRALPALPELVFVSGSVPFIRVSVPGSRFSLFLRGRMCKYKYTSSQDNRDDQFVTSLSLSCDGATYTNCQ